MPTSPVSEGQTPDQAKLELPANPDQAMPFTADHDKDQHWTSGLMGC